MASVGSYFFSLCRCCGCGVETTAGGHGLQPLPAGQLQQLLPVLYLGHLRQLAPIGAQVQGFARARVQAIQRMGVQPQALTTQALRPPAVECAFAVRGIAQDGVGHML